MFQIIKCPGHSGYHKSTLEKHIQRNHYKTTSKSLNELWNKKSKASKDEITAVNSIFITEAGLPMTFFDKPATKTWLEKISNITGSSEISEIGTSARTIGRYHEKTVTKLKNLLRSVGPKLAKKGRLSVQADHYHSRHLSAEIPRSFLGIILCFRDSNYELKKIPLSFIPAKSHSFSQF